MTPEDLYEIIKDEPNKLNLLLGTLNLLKKNEGFEQDLLTPGFIKEWAYI